MTSHIQAQRCRILLPTYNEEASIAQTIDDVMQYAFGSEIVVIDSFSQDRTEEIAVQMGVCIMKIPGRGKGRAVSGALWQLLKSSMPYYIMMDSDYTYPAKHLPDIIAQLDKGFDVVMGYRARRQNGSMTLVNLMGNKALSLLASVLYGHRVKDVCTGMWGFRASVLRKFVLTSTGFTLEADLFANSVMASCNIAQIPISYRARLNGSSPKLKVSDGFKIGWFLIKRRLSHE